MNYKFCGKCDCIHANFGSSFARACRSDKAVRFFHANITNAGEIFNIRTKGIVRYMATQFMCHFVQQAIGPLEQWATWRHLKYKEKWKSSDTENGSHLGEEFQEDCIDPKEKPRTSTDRQDHQETWRGIASEVLLEMLQKVMTVRCRVEPCLRDNGGCCIFCWFL